MNANPRKFCEVRVQGRQDACGTSSLSEKLFLKNNPFDDIVRIVYIVLQTNGEYI